MESTPFQKAIEAVECLPLEDQEMVVDVIRRRNLDRRRDEIASNARESLAAVRENTAKFGTVDDLRAELEDE